MFGLGMGEVLLLFIFALIFIGPKKLPEMAKWLGKGLKEFNQARQDFMDGIHHSSSSSSPSSSSPPMPPSTSPSPTPSTSTLTPSLGSFPSSTVSPGPQELKEVTEKERNLTPNDPNPEPFPDPISAEKGES